MDAIDLLKKDHRKVEELFAQFLESEDDSRQEEIFQEIQTELLVHSEAEEKAFYPALETVAPDKVGEAVSDHRDIKNVLAELLEMEIEDEDFDNRFARLVEMVEEHVQEEEADDGLMELARRELDAEAMTRMTREIENIKKDVEGELAA